MALDAQTERALRNVRERNRETALHTARIMRDRLDHTIKCLATSGLPTESLADLNAVLDTRLAALQTQHELAEIIRADGT